jgi:hypothetical protein
MMPTYNTKRLLRELHEQTQNFLTEAISEWQLMPAELLLEQPAPGKWSAAQCLEHLNSYGRFYLPAIEHAISAARSQGQVAAASFTTGWLGNYFTNTMKPSANMKKMKAPKEHIPMVELDAVKVVSEFIDQQEKLLQLLDAASHVDLNKARVPISIAKFIRLKLGDVLLFVVAHNQRHIVQAGKAIENEKCKV